MKFYMLCAFVEGEEGLYVYNNNPLSAKLFTPFDKHSTYGNVTLFVSEEHALKFLKSFEGVFTEQYTRLFLKEIDFSLSDFY